MLQAALKNVADGLFALVYPQSCRVCGLAVESRDDGVACARCWSNHKITRLLGEEVCFKCGAPFGSLIASMEGTARAGKQLGSEGSTSEERSCRKCEKLPFSAARACGAYSGALEASILFLKSHPHICRRLRAIIAHTYDAHTEALTSDVVIPVPLHRRRERERGFNQAKLIAQVLSKSFGLAMDDRAVARVKHTEMHRAGMDAIDRAKSVERAFEIKQPQLVNEKRVLLVDDVYTTGSTINALAKTLLEAGVSRVNVFTIARVPDRY